MSEYPHGIQPITPTQYEASKKRDKIIPAQLGVASLQDLVVLFMKESVGPGEAHALRMPVHVLKKRQLDNLSYAILYGLAELDQYQADIFTAEGLAIHPRTEDTVSEMHFAAHLMDATDLELNMFTVARELVAV